MKALSVASEIYPLVKTGGLADVAGALPLALSRHGVAMRSLLPGYPAVLAAIGEAETVHVWTDLLGMEARLLATSHAGLDLFVLVCDSLFNRSGGPYGDATGADWPDNWLRFAALARAGADIATGLLPGFHPDIVHAHDWQAGLTPAYMHCDGALQPSVMTVHNIAFQGQFAPSIFPALRLPAVALGVDGVEYYGDVGFLKAGMQKAHWITTVSPAYAQEIRTPGFGMGLDGLANVRAAHLSGILNGIDTDTWDPAADPALAKTFTARVLANRSVNKRAAEARFGLHEEDGLLACVISRLTWQKGMDVLVESLYAIAALGVRLAVLGSGDKAMEAAIAAAAARHPGRIGVSTGYDENLSHLMQGGADAILIPSRFEPCGLTQLYGLRYGCVPVVTRTGGLADTVIDANEAALAAGVASGFQFAPLNAEMLVQAVRRTAGVFADVKAWATLQRNGMKADVSWDASARRYAELYTHLIEKARP
ncbi:MAG TPA: glycogen synthase GlgA, partial [Rhizobiaceae bacterium]|nr:glycogen synthase GlgA [Rhizobiaceae bacterium]